MNENQINNALAWVSAKSSEGYNLCHWMLALGSTYLIFTRVVSAGQEAGYHFALVYIAAYVIAAAWYAGIEHTLKVLLPFAVAYILTDKATANNMGKNARRAGRMSIGTVCVLLTATMGLSVLINPEISSDVTKRESSDVEVAESESVRTSYDKDVAIFQTELKEAKETDTQAIVDAKADAARWVVNAQNAQGITVGNLIRAGNVWAPKQLSKKQTKKIRTERARGERSIKAAKDNASAPTLQGKLTNYMDRSGAARDTVAMTTAALVFGREEDYNEDVSGLNTTLFFVVIGLFFAYIFLCFQMVLGRIERGEDIVDDDSPGVFKVAKKAAATMNKKIAAKLADKWDIQFVSVAPVALASSGAKTVLPPSGTVSKPSAKPSAMPTIAPPSVPLTPAVKPSVPPSAPSLVSVSVSTAGSVSKLTVVFDGKTYSAASAMDKMRKWYKHSKNAKKESTRTSNRKKYEAAKKGTSTYFKFTERSKSVAIEQK